MLLKTQLRLPFGMVLISLGVNYTNAGLTKESVYIRQEIEYSIDRIDFQLFCKEALPLFVFQPSTSISL